MNKYITVLMDLYKDMDMKNQDSDKKKKDLQKKWKSVNAADRLKTF